MSMDKKRNYQLNKLQLGSTGTFIPMMLDCIQKVSNYAPHANSACFHFKMISISTDSNICRGAIHSQFKGSRCFNYPFIHQNDVCYLPSSSVRKTKTKFQFLKERQLISLGSQLEIFFGMLQLLLLLKLAVDHLVIVSSMMCNGFRVNVWKIPSCRKMTWINVSTSEQLAG